MSGLNDRIWKGSEVIQSDSELGPDQWVNPTPAELMNLDDIWKASNKSNHTSKGLMIPASLHEDSIDAVRGLFYKWIECVVHGSVTVKGSVQGFLFQRCVLNGTVELGQFDNYWYPGRLPTREGKIENCTKTIGNKKIKCVLWDAVKPEVVDSDVEFVVMPKWQWYPFFLSQYAWVRLVNLKRRIMGQKLIATS